MDLMTEFLGPFLLYGFNVTKANGKRIGVIIRWRPGKPDLPAPLVKLCVKYPDAVEVHELDFLPISAKKMYDATHPWDWEQE